MPLIAISGGGQRGCKSYLRWAKEFGADMVVPKPFRMSILLLMAKQLMRERVQKTHSGLDMDDFNPTDPLEHIFAS